MQLQNNNDELLNKAIFIIDSGRKKIVEATYNESTTGEFRFYRRGLKNGI